MGANLHAAITANTLAIIKGNGSAGFKNSRSRAIGPALPAGAAASGINNRFLEDMRPDKPL